MSEFVLYIYYYAIIEDVDFYPKEDPVHRQCSFDAKYNKRFKFCPDCGHPNKPCPKQLTREVNIPEGYIFRYQRPDYNVSMRDYHQDDLRDRGRIYLAKEVFCEIDVVAMTEPELAKSLVDIKRVASDAGLKIKETGCFVRQDKEPNHYGY